MNNKRRNHFATTTLRFYVYPDIQLQIKAVGYATKKARRTLLLHILKSLKRELKDIRTGAVIYHSDTSILRWMIDRFKEASTYQATETRTAAQKYGHKVRSLRNGLGMTQAQFATLLNIRRTYLSRIEKGHHELCAERKQQINDLLIELYLRKTGMQDPEIIAGEVKRLSMPAIQTIGEFLEKLSSDFQKKGPPTEPTEELVH